MDFERLEQLLETLAEAVEDLGEAAAKQPAPVVNIPELAAPTVTVQAPAVEAPPVSVQPNINVQPNQPRRWVCKVLDRDKGGSLKEFEIVPQ